MVGIFDGCNLYQRSAFNGCGIEYAGIGRGQKKPDPSLVDFVVKGFRAMERGVANELKAFIDFANHRYVEDEFNRADFDEVRYIAGTCVTGCDIVEPGPIESIQEYNGFVPRLVKAAFMAQDNRSTV